MRIGYAEEESFPGQAELWEANLRRSLEGRKGQQSLRELEAALLALPEKRLIADELESDKGEVCAVGALAKFKHYSGSMSLPEVYDELDEYKVEEAMLAVAKDLGVPKLVAVAIIQQNDEDAHHHSMTPERRYERLLDWTQQRINMPEREAETTTSR